MYICIHIYTLAPAPARFPAQFLKKVSSTVIVHSKFSSELNFEKISIWKK